MVRVIGNSAERVKITDLSDVIYFKQQKEYTDQDYDRSRDLKREITAGRLLLVSKPATVSHGVSSPGSIDPSKSSPSINPVDLKHMIGEVLLEHQQGSPISIEDIKKVILETIGTAQQGPSDLSVVLQTLIPVISEAVRQEVANIPRGNSSSAPSSVALNGASTFRGPDYIPTINTDGMVSSVKGEERSSSGSGVSSSLDALKRLKK